MEFLDWCIWRYNGEIWSKTNGKSAKPPDIAMCCQAPDYTIWQVIMARLFLVSMGEKIWCIFSTFSTTISQLKQSAHYFWNKRKELLYVSIYWTSLQPVWLKQICLIFWRTHSHVPFWSHRYPCFWISSDVSSRFIRIAEVNVMYISWDPLLVAHVVKLLAVCLAKWRNLYTIILFCHKKK